MQALPLRRALAALAVMLLALPAAAQAQAGADAKNVLSVNPFGIVFSIISAEYERALNPNVSLGISTTWWDFDEDDDTGDITDEFTYTSADAKLRYYPSSVLRGFSVGVLGGITKVTGTDCEFGGTCEDTSETVPSAGVGLDYSWRLGAAEKFYIGLGVGAKRIFIDEDDFDGTVAYPFARFNIGWAF